MSNTTFRVTADFQPGIVMPICASYDAAARTRVDAWTVATHVPARVMGATPGHPSWSPPIC